MPTYREAGVDLYAAERLVDDIAPVVQATWGPEVVGGFGGFAAGIRIPPEYREPVLMMSTDGIGTKIEVAIAADRLEGLGRDLVAMCVDDLAAVGARPIAFTDYLAVGRLDPARERTLIASVAEACSYAGCALLGGETAEHPGVMPTHTFDFAGAALGVVEQDDVITGQSIQAGDVVIGVASTNLRSNGFSLVRAVIADADLSSRHSQDRSLGEVLCEPSIIYSPAVLDAIATRHVRGLAHITGGALPGNLPRILPPGLGLVVRRDAWPIPEVFRFVQRLGAISDETMYETFNMGIGYAVIAPQEGVGPVQAAFEARDHETWVIGEVSTGAPRFRFA